MEPQGDEQVGLYPAAKTTTTPQISPEPSDSAQPIGLVVARRCSPAVRSDLDCVGSEEECLVLLPSDDQFSEFSGYPASIEKDAPCHRGYVYRHGLSGRAGTGSIPGSCSDNLVQSCLSCRGCPPFAYSRFLSST